MKQDIKAAVKSSKEIYDRYLYILIKPTLVLLFILLTIKLLSFVVVNVISIINIIMALTLPFILGVLMSLSLEPINRFMQKKFKFPRAVAVSLSLFITILILAFIVFSIIYVAIFQLIELSNRVIDISKDIDYQNTGQYVKDFVHNSFLSKYISDEQINSMIISLKENMDSFTKNSAHMFATIGKNVADSATNIFLKTIPSMLVTVFIAIFTSFFVSKDKDKIIAFSKEHLPPTFYQNVLKIHKESVKNLISYVKGQFILVTISGVILLVGFLVAQTPYALALAVFCIFLDLIPVVGTIIVVAPLCVYSLTTGDLYSFWVLLIAYIVSIGVRQVIEPKIMGDSLGFHPLLLIIALFVGVEIFGGIGIILGPVTLIFIKILFDTKILKMRKYNADSEVTSEHKD